MNKQIIIIGNGAAGNAALEEILNHSNTNKITVITKEASPVYYRPMLSEYLSQPDVPKRFFLHDDKWYTSNDVNVHYETEVINIDRSNLQITLSNNEKMHYDKLIICSGSKNFIPPISGHDLSNVVDLRTLIDAEQIKKLTVKSKTAVIIGGGLLGLELGWQLTKLNIDVTVVEMMDRLLPRQLDSEASKLFEEKVLETGIKVLLGAQTKEITGTTHAEGVSLSDGTLLPADLVAFSIGIRADVALAKAAGIEANRGILVDDFMKTNDPNIFAAGDCAEHKGINYAIWPEAIAQGRIAGLNAIGVSTVYDPIIPFNVYHGMDMRLFSLGDVGTNPEQQYDVIQNKHEDYFEKFFFIDNVFCGGILIGNISKSGKLKNALTEKMSLEAFKKIL